ncbi:MAG: FtsW/RodA/SpoVE family cell cycle protein [Anaerolineales bacterium]|nr:FtsW/RodA/SpoVE family cell cycle protein [Anaerolineales bacterium]
MLNAKLWRHFDFWLLGAVLLLCLFGIAMIRSATLTNEVLADTANRQALFLGLGLAALIVVSMVDYRLYGAAATSLYTILLILLAIVWLIAPTVFGASRWIPIGAYNLQPSELGKFIIILTLGHYLITHAEEAGRFSLLVKTLVHVGVPVLLILFQPDLSSCILYGVIWLSLLWSMGMRFSHLLVLTGVGAVVAVIGVLAALASDEFRYIGLRVLNFLYPDPNSQQYRESFYNINQALIAVGSGGWTGEGYGQGSQVQLRFLKVRHTDFIFASIAHEFGFVGAVLVILTFVFIIFRIYRAAQLARDPYGRLICLGVGTVIFFEVFTNIASNLNLLPVTGAPLPFISYGGSSLVTFLVGIGLVQSVILRHKEIEF